NTQTMDWKANTSLTQAYQTALQALSQGDRSKAAKIYALDAVVVVRYESGFTVAVNTGKTGQAVNLSKLASNLPEKQSLGAFEFKIWK
ncbi:MAG: hypothetical protein SPK80_08675, partial [Bacteroidales bacterium]|nr:hypothetical protein [Bacteroidales bacterium]